LAELNKLLAGQANTDGLTGLHNHRRFRSELEKHFLACKARRGLLSVVLLDVDRFKVFNDSFGHPAGDEVLKAVADELTRCARSDDLVARYGGEEFVVVLPDADAEVAVIVANRLRTAIERRSWPFHPITASFGVSTLTGRTATSSELVDQADRAMYASKHSGRNRVTHYNDVGDEEELEKAAA
jgi:diguanylate cyclase (GGDEF)-like protein